MAILTADIQQFQERLPLPFRKGVVYFGNERDIQIYGVTVIRDWSFLRITNEEHLSQRLGCLLKDTIRSDVVLVNCAQRML